MEKQLDEIDRKSEELENLLVSTPSSSLEEIEAVISLAVVRFHEIIVTDPDDVFYDHGEARLLALEAAPPRMQRRSLQHLLLAPESRRAAPAVHALP